MMTATKKINVLMLGYITDNLITHLRRDKEFISYGISLTIVERDMYKIKFFHVSRYFTDFPAIKQLVKHMDIVIYGVRL